MPSRRYNKPVKPHKACRKHPNQPAVADSDLCASCYHYEQLGKKGALGPPPAKTG